MKNGLARARRLAWVLALPLALLTVLVAATGAEAATGDVVARVTIDRSGTLCATANPDPPGYYDNVGVAFDGANLLVSCSEDNTIIKADPVTGAQLAVYHIKGTSDGSVAPFAGSELVADLGALAWDRTRNVVWACSGFVDVISIDLAAREVSFHFSVDTVGDLPDGSIGTLGYYRCYSGLAFDSNGTSDPGDDVIWTVAPQWDAVTGADGNPMAVPQPPVSAQKWATYDSPDGSIYPGYLLAEFPATGTPDGKGYVGIAAGGANLYLATNPAPSSSAAKVLEAAKGFSTVTSYFNTNGVSPKDLECDNRTFSGSGKTVLWGIQDDSAVLTAWEVAPGACAYGGGTVGGTEPSPPPPEVCGDGIDNDLDGLVDEGCGVPVEVCGNGTDDDGDGQIDEGCVEVCGNGIDDNSDGQIDEGCPPPPPPPPPPPMPWVFGAGKIDLGNVKDQSQKFAFQLRPNKDGALDVKLVFTDRVTVKQPKETGKPEKGEKNKEPSVSSGRRPQLTPTPTLAVPLVETIAVEVKGVADSFTVVTAGSKPVGYRFTTACQVTVSTSPAARSKPQPIDALCDIWAVDKGKPGKGKDEFSLRIIPSPDLPPDLQEGYLSGGASASKTLDEGNIHAFTPHKPKKVEPKELAEKLLKELRKKLGVDR